MDGPSQAPGFFGKLPSHGDFVGRRLPPDVRDCFDRWLQAALVQSRADLGNAWLPTWLSSPLWRFVVGAGVCGEQAWAGVMMPSHDRVGRCFPLLLAAAIDGTPSLLDCMSAHAAWFERLEDLALTTLEDGFTLEAFDAALLGLAGAPTPASMTAARAVAVAAAAGAGSGALVEAFGTGGIPALAHAPLAKGHSAWWTDGSGQVAPCLATCDGLPVPEAFAALLDGRWMQRQWS